jgi:hypothetical protein
MSGLHPRIRRETMADETGIIRLKYKKGKLEKTIEVLLTNFSQETGLEVERLDIEIPNVTEDSLPILCYRVKVKAVL